MNYEVGDDLSVCVKCVGEPKKACSEVVGKCCETDNCIKEMVDDCKWRKLIENTVQYPSSQYPSFFFWYLLTLVMLDKGS